MRLKDSYVQERDAPGLRYFGFDLGWSGSSWFGTDKSGQMWQVITDLNDGLLHFRKYYGVKGTSGARPMKQDEFLKTFKVMGD